jgi:heme/copper-type cytochrome/quinol oxidase subunit 3
MQAVAKIDVSHLPDHAFGADAPLWWANTLLLFIETTMFALLAATYFYLRQGFHLWPPVQPGTDPPLFNTLPDLWASTTVLVILVLGCIPVALMHVGALRMSAPTVRAGLVVTILVTIGAIIVRCFEFQTLHFMWNDNAYGSITWTILGVHLIHLVVIFGELGILASYNLTHPLEPKRALDVTLAAIYFYWIAAMWVVFYLIVYWTPRWYYAGPAT